MPKPCSVRQVGCEIIHLAFLRSRNLFQHPITAIGLVKGELGWRIQPSFAEWQGNTTTTARCGRAWCPGYSMLLTGSLTRFLNFVASLSSKVVFGDQIEKTQRSG
jgi:hypothetical protein